MGRGDLGLWWWWWGGRVAMQHESAQRPEVLDMRVACSSDAAAPEGPPALPSLQHRIGIHEMLMRDQRAVHLRPLRL